MSSGCLKCVSGDSHFCCTSLMKKHHRCLLLLCKSLILLMQNWTESNHLWLNFLCVGDCCDGIWDHTMKGLWLSYFGTPKLYSHVFLQICLEKKGLHSSADLACSVLQHKGNLSWKKHNQYLSPPAWQSKVQPWLWSLVVRFVRECSVPEELIKPGNV